MKLNELEIKDKLVSFWRAYKKRLEGHLLLQRLSTVAILFVFVSIIFVILTVPVVRATFFLTAVGVLLWFTIDALRECFFD